MTERLGTKAETLARLESAVTLGHIKPQLAFTVEEWGEGPEDIVASIARRFEDHTVVVRSSATSEDTPSESKAGLHTSLLDVDSADPACVARAVETVIASYTAGVPGDQVLVQEQLGDIHLCGVLFTRDLATLARAIVTEFPKFYQWHSVREFTHNNIKQSNRNSLLWRDDSVDGLKTGHTEAAGYCLVASAKRDDMRLISVVLGTSSIKTRTDGSQALLNYGFRFFETRLLFKAGEVISTARIWKSAKELSQLGVLEDLYITIRRGSYDDLESTLDIPAILLAPVAAGQPLAELKVSLDDEPIVTAPLRALDDNPVGSFWQRSKDSASLWFE